MATGVVWGLLVVGVVGGQGPYQSPPSPPQYRFDGPITRTDEWGRKERVASLGLLALEGNTAKWFSGGGVAVPGFDEVREVTETGYGAEMSVKRMKDGKLLLDATVKLVKPQRFPDGGVRIRTQSVRAVQVVNPKEPVTLKVGPYTFKVQVQPVS
jgi:hypothetical protein